MNAIRLYQQQQHELEIERLHRNAAPLPLVVVPNPKPSLADRFAAACWRLHDGMPIVWAVIGVCVLAPLVGLGAALLAMCFGWQP